ncbi:glycoside hydrolase family 3 C-terminal domain-containing protein [Sphingomonas sp. PB2P19]|uniref:beta-glucosidase n=1 Tax=Sphingomonas rhamnosi TaxID=3096156 RepID=UPI002FCCA0B0
MTRIRMLSLVLLAGVAAAPSLAQTQARTQGGAPARAWSDPKLSPDARAALIVAQMTRDEKLTLVFGYLATDFAPKKYVAPAEGRAGSAGYVPGIPRLGIPPQWQTDAGMGVATQGSAVVKRERTALPSGIATTATWDPDMAYRGGAMIGDEAHRSGFNVLLAGGVNLMRDPRNGRNFEYGGEDPLLAGTMSGAQIAGIQSAHVVSTIKHYAINDQETDRDTGNSVIDPAAARVSDLLAFQIGIERSNAGAIMCSYNRVNGTHSCENPFLLTDVLRRDWKWPGFVMSDWGATHSTVAAANAGLDQDSGFPFDTQPFFGKPLADAVASGAVSEARLTEMASRILRTMFANGLFEHPVAERPIDFAAHAAVSRSDAEAGAVLLRNEAALLPLSPSVKRIAVIGGYADKGVLAGGGSSLVYPAGGNAVPGLAPTTWPGPVMYYPSAPLEAIRKLAPQAKVTFASGKDPAAAAALARDADVVIVFATQWAGEAFDVSLSLGKQDALIDAVAAANPRTAVVLETGGPVLLPWAPRVGAILEAWYPGTAGGDAIANLLFGRTAPSGRLPATFPRSVDQLPRPQAPKAGDTRYDEGATVGYKWYDQKRHDPLYAFGHGLTYTSFAYRDLKAVVRDGTVVASVRVDNVGKRAGSAVPQIYVAPVAGGWEAPKRLGGWQKLALQPGANGSVSVTVDPRLLATWDESRREWSIREGDYQVMLGDSAREIRQTVLVHVPARVLPVGWRP